MIPSLRINATYYGWRFAGYLAMVFPASAVMAGIMMHAALFSVLGLIPEATAGQVDEMAQFRIDYVFFLNLAALCLTGVLLCQIRGSANRG